ncbi:MAG: hypothetical protein KJT03_01830, partial [Verrucomicrobiae bacterium]|nr:hypothetical protein [Verrucomicrobiae bacterium]
MSNFQMFFAPSTIIIDAISLKTSIIRKSYFSVGYGKDNTCNLGDRVSSIRLLTFKKTAGGFEVFPEDPNENFRINEKLSIGDFLEIGAVYALEITGVFLLVYITNKPKQWLEGINLSQWRVFEPLTGSVHGPLTRAELPDWVSKSGKDPSKLKFVPKGMNTGFRVDHILGIESSTASKLEEKKPPSSSIDNHQEPQGRELDSDQQRCTHCWSPVFDDELLSIASHESLRGDPVLGGEEMLRFKPKKFDPRRIPLDEAGSPCPEYACPNCRLKVIRGLGQLPQAFISVFGSPGAGKSYFLSVLTDQLPRKALENWNVLWEDPDPTLNAPLNDMRHRLFSAQFATDAYLAKTSLDGHLYHKTVIHGRQTLLPSPFTYILEGQGKSQSITFYDNAGEQYQPGMDGIANPVTHHLAHAHLWCFLFDPSKDKTFREMLKRSGDPQLRRSFPKEDQELLLSELKSRVRTLHGLSPIGKLNTPMAFIIGKMDMLKEWDPVSRLKDPWIGNCLKAEIVEENSQMLREGLWKIAPTIVSRAEAVSEKVVYFASTTFGHSPRVLKDGRLSPLPSFIKPIGVEVPIMWWLSCWSDVFRSFNRLEKHAD